jgi:hypothetical protein
MVEIRSAYKLLVGKPERKRLLGNLSVYGKIILECMEVGWEGVDCMHMAQDRD